jgi:aminoglycoside phosphotransferase family enzyme/predicted kinase
MVLRRGAEARLMTERAEPAPDLPAALLRPEAYEADPGRIELRATHASWVFLTAREAWKVKRPVDLGFLDFRSIESRRRACEEEVRLNRRLAPDVYLGVNPVRRTPAGFGFVGDGAIVDWAVRMRRLPDDASASALLAEGRLDARLLARLAGRLAAFLQEAPVASHFGMPDAVAFNLDENFDQVAPFVGDLVDQQTFDQVQMFQRRELARQRERFVARVAEERIREGHGDLRLEHVYFLPAPDGRLEPTVIDCIEFNERFRCGDAAAELAFAAMELEAAGRPDLAAGLVARFAEASDDFGLYGVLDFYLSYRAWVRGKVAAFVASDPSAGGELRAAKRVEAHRCFGLARASAGAPLDRPFAIAVGGLIGSGKSTLAADLGHELAVPVVSSDRTRKAAAGVAPTARADPRAYTSVARDRTYEEIIRRAGQVLGAGRGVIVDATFSTARWRQRAAEAARAANATFVWVEACCPAGLLRQRLAARRQSASVSDADETLLDDFVRAYEPAGVLDPEVHLSVDTSQDPPSATTAALAGLLAFGITPARDRRAS